jgi:hypothetical protein
VTWNYSNTAAETVLSAGITAGQTTIALGSVTGFPVIYPYTLIIEHATANEEIVNVISSAGGLVLNVTRGQDGTSAIGHAINSTVIHGVVARDVAEPQAHIAGTTNVHGLTGGSGVAGTSQSQTLTNKTMSGASNVFTNLPAAQVTGTFPALTTSGNVSAVDGAFSGDVTVGDDLTVTDLVAAARVTTTGAATVGTTLGVTGISTVGVLHATGAVDFDSTLNVDGNVDLNAQLSVTGVATLDSNLDVLGNLTVTGTGPYFRNVDFQSFGTSGTWTKPTGAKWVRVVCVGGGGAGGGCGAPAAGQAAAGHGGQAGGYGERWFAASALAATETVTIGAGGTGVSAAAGNPGVATTFSTAGTQVKGDGGAGGTLLATSSGFGFTTGPALTQTNTGTITARGNPGAQGIRNGPDGAGGGGNGGSSVRGGAGTGGVGAAGIAAEANSGSGGGGASANASGSAAAGGAGGSGICVVTTLT